VGEGEDGQEVAGLHARDGPGVLAEPVLDPAGSFVDGRARELLLEAADGGVGLALEGAL